MRGINIPPFPHKVEITDLDHFFGARLDKKTVMWPEQALPLLCYMCFPSDEAARDDLLRTLWSWDGSEKPVVPPELRRIQANWSKIADIFHTYCDLVEGGHQKRRGGPSIEKAVKLTHEKAQTWGTGKSKLWEIWKQYKDVAHLVTAASLVSVEVRHRYRKGLLPHLALDPDQIVPFQMTMLMPDLVLALAMDAQRIGLTIVGDSRSRTALDPDLLWRIPSEVELNIALMPLPLRTLRKRDLDILRDRRAGNRGNANSKSERNDL